MKLSRVSSTVSVRLAEAVSMKPASGPTEEIKINFFEQKPEAAPLTHSPKFIKPNQEGRFQPPLNLKPITEPENGPTFESPEPSPQPDSKSFPTNRPNSYAKPEQAYSQGAYSS